MIGTIAPGYDTAYVWQQVGKGGERSAGRTAAGYYLAPAEGGGEPPGRWYGKGAEALGLRGLVERKPYDLLFGQRLAPDGVTRLGRGRVAARSAASVYAQLLEAEPHATAERKAELRAEASRQERHPPLYFDVTFSVQKSVSVLHASIGENVRQARLAGDADAEAYWAGWLAKFDEAIHAGNRAGLDYFCEHAGFTRTGYHGAKAAGRETGKFVEADLAVASWFQHTSRDGDMQLHVHNQIAHVALTRADGKWRAPYSRGYKEYVGAAAQVAALHLESELTRMLGVDWVARADGYGVEVKGIPGGVLEEFSSRRAAITPKLAKLAEVFAQEHGRPPAQYELSQLAQKANLLTRDGKEETALDHDGLRAGWDERLRDKHGMTLADIARDVAPKLTGPAQPAQDEAAPEAAGLSLLAEHQVVQQALAAVSARSARWTRSDLLQQLGHALPPEARRLDPAGSVALLERLADEALLSMHEPVSCLEAPQYPPVPAGMLRADGRSVYQQHGGTLYATNVQLSMEEQLLQDAQGVCTARLHRAESAQMLQADPDHLEQALHDRAQDASTVLPGGLREDQAAAIHHALTSARTVEVITGPAGSGKTRTLAEAARMWAAHGGRVAGVTPSQASRNVLADAGVPDVANFAQFLGHVPDQRGALGPRALERGTLILIDEGSMLSNQGHARHHPPCPPQRLQGHRLRRPGAAVSGRGRRRDDAAG